MQQVKFMSEESIARFFRIPKEQAHLVKKVACAGNQVVLAASCDDNAFASVWEHVYQRRFEPNLAELRMELFNAALEMFGVEYFEHKRKKYEYCNSGDSYAATIVYCSGKFYATTVGDVVER